MASYYDLGSDPENGLDPFQRAQILKMNAALSAQQQESEEASRRQADASFYNQQAMGGYYGQKYGNGGGSRGAQGGGYYGQPETSIERYYSPMGSPDNPRIRFSFSDEQDPSMPIPFDMSDVHWRSVAKPLPGGSMTPEDQIAFMEENDLGAFNPRTGSMTRARRDDPAAKMAQGLIKTAAERDVRENPELDPVEVARQAQTSSTIAGIRPPGKSGINVQVGPAKKFAPAIEQRIAKNVKAYGRPREEVVAAMRAKGLI